MVLPLWYAILFGLTFILESSLIVYCTRLYPDYSIFSRTISGLGNPMYKSAKIFNPTISIMGVILSPLPYYLLQVLPPHWMTSIGIGAFFCSPVGIFLVGIFHEERQIGHLIAATLGMGGLITANMVLLYPIFLSSLSNIITAITIISLITSIFLAIAGIKNIRTYIPNKRITKLLYNLNFWEWIQFIILQVWLGGIYINLLIAF
ncbi:MAG: DUF998 domain-containing protein [Candidatus Helarchaeota archaeon]|nr:DUF998 domain-containing protein [Candidatus Helarchaeota archaeon]